MIPLSSVFVCDLGVLKEITVYSDIFLLHFSINLMIVGLTARFFIIHFEPIFVYDES